VKVFVLAEKLQATKLTFLRYINRQLQRMAFRDTVRCERVCGCGCGYPAPVRPAAVEWRVVKRLDSGLRELGILPWLACPVSRSFQRLKPCSTGSRALQWSSGRTRSATGRSTSITRWSSG
jgi:hypothetical protein